MFRRIRSHPDTRYVGAWSVYAGKVVEILGMTPRSGVLAIGYITTQMRRWNSVGRRYRTVNRMARPAYAGVLCGGGGETSVSEREMSDNPEGCPTRLSRVVSATRSGETSIRRRDIRTALCILGPEVCPRLVLGRSAGSCVVATRRSSRCGRANGTILLFVIVAD